MLQGHHKEAELYFREVLAESKALLPLGHPDIFDSAKSVATAVAYQGRYTEAEYMLQNTLRWCAKTLGDEHLTTRRIMAAHSMCNKTARQIQRRSSSSTRAAKDQEKGLGREPS